MKIEKSKYESRFKQEYNKAKKTMGRDLTPNERIKLKRIVKQEMQKEKRRKIIGIAALGLTTGSVFFGVMSNQIKQAQLAQETAKVKTEANITSQESERTTFLNRIKIKEQDTVKEENEILSYFSEEYNKQFPEANISEEDLGIIGKTANNFYIVDLDEQENIVRFSQDTNIASVDQLTENQDFLQNGDYGVSDIGSNYVVVNKNNNRIIAPAIGKIKVQGEQDSQMILIDTDSVRLISNGKEYISGDSVMQIPEDQETLKQLYNQLEEKYEEIVEKQNKEKTQMATIENNDYER